MGYLPADAADVAEGFVEVIHAALTL